MLALLHPAVELVGGYPASAIKASLRGVHLEQASLWGPAAGCFWWLAGEDEKEFRSQDYPRNLNESQAIADRGKLRALIGDVLVASAGVGIRERCIFVALWEPGMRASSGPQISLVPLESGWMLGLRGEF